jgi:hypothetical protein
MTTDMPRPGPSSVPGGADCGPGPTTPEADKATPGKSYAAGDGQSMPTNYRGRPVVKLNLHWAVSDGGALQWLLLRRAGDDWHPRRFHVESDALLRSIRERCGTVDAAAIATIRGWPALYRPDALALPTRRAGAANA